jgi:hypothetical protein
MMKRVAGLWRQFNDEGMMSVERLTDHGGDIVVDGLSEPDPTFCLVLTGWVREVGKAMDIKDPVVRHTQCMCKGHDRCVWDVRWASVRPDEHVIPAPDASSASSSTVRAATARMSSQKMNVASPQSSASGLKAAKPDSAPRPPPAPSTPPGSVDVPSTKRSPK